MKKILIFVLVLITTLLFGFRLDISDVGSEQKEYTLSQRIKCLYFYQDEFMTSVNNAKEVSGVKGLIAGGVVPHHLLARNMIADFFAALSERKPETIIILAPNHKRIGEKKVITSLQDWETYFGILETNGELAGKLIKSGTAASKSTVLEEDHSISSLIPYIKYYMPDSKVVPLLLHGNLGLPDSVKLGNYIGTIAKDNNCVVIASVDFSHYLSVEKADIMDSITLDAIKRRDIRAISKMTNDNLDSPPSIISLLTAMDTMGAGDMLLIENNNSAKISGQSPDYTTSYFTMLLSQTDSSMKSEEDLLIR
ncbi:MAG: AmmeMemoRadiSam system protein B [Clostridiaceae bacterium]|nr:AmmeMemoRadiSam system protein B [Clostridiaceae bacterium]